MAEVHTVSYAENMKPDNQVDMGDYICTNIKDFGEGGEACNLYPQTHKHYKKEA